MVGLLRVIGLTGVMGLLASTHPSSSYTLRKTHDSLYYLNEWQLPYPVYRFDTADVDGDGKVDALVGVVKTTRYDPTPARRLFIFKQVNGRVRPLWLGSRLGGILQDFRCRSDGAVIALERTADARFSVTEYRWAGFGLKFCRYIVRHTDQLTAENHFNTL